MSKTNKEYRKYPNIEDTMYKLSDIVDLCDECKDNLRYVENIEDTKDKIKEIKSIIVEVEKLLEKYDDQTYNA